MISLTMLTKLTRIVFCLLFLSQLFSIRTNENTSFTVEAAYFDFKQIASVPSCKDHGVHAGPTLDIECTRYCYPYTMESTDYMDTTEDPNYVIRNTVCQCYEGGESPTAPRQRTLECRTKDQVWDKNAPVLKCLDDYGIFSSATCQIFCRNIDPAAFSYSGLSGQSVCGCGPGLPICDDLSVGTTRTTTLSIVIALVVGCVATFLS